jgi:hypothetical protein
MAYEITESIRDIFAFKSLEISPTPDNNDIKVVINGKSYRIREVGSGISQFLMLLVTAAVSRPEYILIDEPELSLHPIMQQRLLEELQRYAKSGVVFSTHSIGLARATASAIYSIQRKPGADHSRVSTFSQTLSLPEFLGEMSFSSLKEAGVKRLLLVEGHTDVQVYKHFLRLLGLSGGTAVIPLGGGAMIHRDRAPELTEVRRLHGNILAIVDSERTERNGEPAESHADFQDLCERLGIPCALTDRRATENYFPQRAIEAALGKTFSALEPYQLLKKSEKRWPKSKNWKIAGSMTKAELVDTDIAVFLLRNWN